MPVRTANAVWSGTIARGSGTMALGSGAYEGPYSVGSRFQEDPGTNPEELIAAAHAGCFSMALSGILSRAGTPAQAVMAPDAGLVTDSAFGEARPVSRVDDLLRQGLGAVSGLPVLTGYIGRDAEGHLTTLGRNGSDLTAALVARALGCEDRAVPMMADALGTACLARAEMPVDLVFVDPPYTMMQDEASRRRVLAQIERCAPIMSGGFVVLRSPVGPDRADLAVPGFVGPEQHQYRPDMFVLLYQPEQAEADDEPA